VKLIHCQFIGNPQHDQQSAGDTSSEPCNVDSRVTLVSPEMTQCGGEVIAKHKLLVWWLDWQPPDHRKVTKNTFLAFASLFFAHAATFDQLSHTMDSKYQDFIRDVLITIHLNLRELRERKTFADPEELTHIEAKILAYEETLSILRESADQFKIPRDEVGL
jgi:hypothetical protein